jgi:hypothetical protein
MTARNTAARLSFLHRRRAARRARFPFVIVPAELHALLAPLRFAAAGVEWTVRLRSPLAGERVVTDFEGASLVRIGVDACPFTFRRAARHTIFLFLACAAAELAVSRVAGHAVQTDPRAFGLAGPGFSNRRRCSRSATRITARRCGAAGSCRPPPIACTRHRSARRQRLPARPRFGIRACARRRTSGSARTCVVSSRAATRTNHCKHTFLAPSPALAAAPEGAAPLDASWLSRCLSHPAAVNPNAAAATTVTRATSALRRLPRIGFDDLPRISRST